MTKSPNEDRRVYTTKSQQRCNNITPIVEVIYYGCNEITWVVA